MGEGRREGKEGGKEGGRKGGREEGRKEGRKEISTLFLWFYSFLHTYKVGRLLNIHEFKQLF